MINDKLCQNFLVYDGVDNKEEYFDVCGRYVIDVSL